MLLFGFIAALSQLGSCAGTPMVIRSHSGGDLESDSLNAYMSLRIASTTEGVKTYMSPSHRETTSYTLKSSIVDVKFSAQGTPVTVFDVSGSLHSSLRVGH